MNIPRTWKPWVAGAGVLAVVLVAGVTGWQIARDGSDAGHDAHEVTVAEPIEQPTDAVVVEDTADSAAGTAGDPLSSAEPGNGRSGRDGSDGGDATDGPASGHPADISELAGEGEDHGPAEEPDVGGSGADDGVILFMPDIDWTDSSDLLGVDDAPVFDCPPALRLPNGACGVDEPLREPGIIPAPIPGGGF